MMELDPRQYDHVAISDNDVRNIVLSYLVHNCFKETAETFIACSGMKQPADYPVDMDKRKPIFHFALEGNALKAIELTEELAHDLLEKNKDLHFDLLSLHFVELVCSRKCTEALEFAQTKLTPFGNVDKYVEKLEDFMALLAYEEPEKSPMFHLLSMEYRQSVADSLNRAILAHANLPSHSSMERLIQQTTVVRQCLHQELGKGIFQGPGSSGAARATGGHTQGGWLVWGRWPMQLRPHPREWPVRLGPHSCDSGGLCDTTHATWGPRRRVQPGPGLAWAMR